MHELYEENVDRKFICSGIFTVAEMAALFQLGVKAACPIMLNSDVHLISIYTNDISATFEFYDSNMSEGTMLCDTPVELAICARNSLCTLFHEPTDLIPLSFSCYSFGDVSHDYQEATKLMGFLYKDKDFLARRTTKNVNILFLAAEYGDICALKSILNNDDHQELVKLFINLPTGNENVTPLYAAISDGHIEIAELLLDKGADINQAGNKNGATVLHVACASGYLDEVKLLIQKGANINQANYVDGQSPLQTAISNGQLEVAQFLIGEKADINQAATMDGSTPLLLACQNGNADAVELLLQNGANVNQAMADEVTPLIMACWNGNTHLVHILLNHGANIEQLMMGDASPFFISCQNGHLDIVKHLLTYKVRTDRATTEGETPLLIACARSHTEVVNLLLENDVHDINTGTIDNLTPLFWACNNGSLDIAKKLLQKGAGASVNTGCRSNGATPLHCACLRGNPLLVSLLLDYGAETEVVTTDHATPLLLALNSNNFEVVKILVAHGADTTELFKRTLPDGLNKFDLQELAKGAAIAKARSRLTDQTKRNEWASFYKAMPSEEYSQGSDEGNNLENGYQ